MHAMDVHLHLAVTGLATRGRAGWENDAMLGIDRGGGGPEMGHFTRLSDSEIRVAASASREFFTSCYPRGS